MTFREFIEIIINSFNVVLANISKLFEPIMENNFIKLIIYIVIIWLIFDWLGDLIDLVRNIISQKKEAGKNKVSSTRDLE